MSIRSWPSVVVRVVGACIVAASLASPFLASTARAQAGGAAPDQDPGAVARSEDDEANAGTPRSAAPDKLTNHFLLHGDVGVAFPAGSIAADLPFTDVAGPGLTLGGGLGLGLSRYVALDIGATYSKLSAPDICSTCTGKSFDVGLGLAYHVAQGFAIDPWLSVGVGYRSATLTSATIGPSKIIPDATFEGLDLARIGLGGSFFPLPWVGVGPYMQLAFGTTIGRPDPELTPAVYTVFHMGVRIELDLMGRRSAAPGAPAAVGRAKGAESQPNSADFRGSKEGGRSWGGL